MRNTHKSLCSIWEDTLGAVSTRSSRVPVVDARQASLLARPLGKVEEPEALGTFGMIMILESCSQMMVRCVVEVGMFVDWRIVSTNTRAGSLLESISGSRRNRRCTSVGPDTCSFISPAMPSSPTLCRASPTSIVSFHMWSCLF